MAKEYALSSFYHECGVCPKHPSSDDVVSCNSRANLEKKQMENDDYVAKYMVDDASSKKFLVRVEGVVDSDQSPKEQQCYWSISCQYGGDNNSPRFNDNKVKRKYLDTKTDPNKKSNVACWKCEKSGHLKKDCKGGKVGNKSNGSAQMDDDVAWLNIVNDNIGSAFMSTSKLNDSILWHARLGHVHFNRMQDMSKDGLISAFDMDTKNDLCDLHATLSLGNKTYFVTFIDDASRFYVIEPNESVLINSIIKSSDAIFDENRFSSVLRLSLRIPNGTEDIGVSEVFDEVPSGVTEEVTDEMDSIMGNKTWVLADLPSGGKPLGCKWIFKRKLKVDGTIEKFKARLVIQGFRQKSGIDYFDTYAPVARISTIRLLIALASIHNLIIHQMDVKTTFLNSKLDEDVYMNQPYGFIMPGNENKVDLTKEFLSSRFSMKDMGESDVILGPDIAFVVGKLSRYTSNPSTQHWQVTLMQAGSATLKTIRLQVVDLTKEFLSSRFSMKDMRESDVILVSTPMDTSEKLMSNNGQVVSQLEYSRMIGCLMYAMTCTGPDIAFVVGKLSSNIEDNSFTSGWVFLLGGGAISWASKKLNCITSLTIKYEFVALEAAGKETEWLRNLILEILLWSKPITSISIRCDSVATLAKSYSQMHNVKSRHLGVRHNMIRELIMNRMCLEPAEKEDEAFTA
ncbi:zinc finger, CCHC-type containing protein [Tanacetum coccineum]